MTGSNTSGGAPSNYSPCDVLRFEAQLTSPQPAVVVTLIVGEVLMIATANMGGQIVVQVLKNGQIAGGLAGPDAARLRTCMAEGHIFQATVRSIIGGQVRVLVEHA